MEDAIKKKALLRFVSITLLALGDVLAILLSLYLAYVLREHFLYKFITSLKPLYDISIYKKYMFLLFLWPLIFYILELYDHIISSELEIVRAFKGSTIAYILSAIALYMLDVRPRFPRSVFLLSWLFSPFVIIIVRKLIRSFFKRFGLWKYRILIVGDSPEIFIIENTIKYHPNTFNIVKKIDNLDLGTLKKIYKDTKLDIIILAPGAKIAPEVMEFVETEGIELLAITDIFGLRSQGIGTWNISGIVTIKFNYNLFKPLNKYVKFIFDRLFAFFFILFTLPLYPIIAICIKLDSKGPVLYKQTRVGKGGKLFKVYKFRTMYQDADKKLKEILEKDKDARLEWEQYRKLKNDPRITKIGKFLRKTSLDELPQIINILKGEMSLVGPRPVTKEEIENYYKETIKYYYSVLPGITGLWQVSGRNDLDFNARLLLDEYYVLNWSIELDFEIILKTISVVLTGRGAV